ncbi:hypothetical protein X771_32125 [Mesorhizobium sp. LSJC277A00]|nr:hypothetical protein X771_32125 [Mesorhizobium sp. LSJC277A00]
MEMLAAIIGDQTWLDLLVHNSVVEGRIRLPQSS